METLTPERRIEIANRIIADFDAKYTRVKGSEVVDLYQKSCDIGIDMRTIASRMKEMLATPVCVVRPKASDMGIDDDNETEYDAIDTTIDAAIGFTIWVVKDQNDPRWDGEVNLWIREVPAPK